MTIRKQLYLALFCAITTFSPQLLIGTQSSPPTGMDGCTQCSMQLVAPTIALNQLYL